MTRIDPDDLPDAVKHSMHEMHGDTAFEGVFLAFMEGMSGALISLAQSFNRIAGATEQLADAASEIARSAS